MRASLLVGAATVAAALGCSGLAPEVKGSLTVDGGSFTPVGCESGVPLGFTGVQLTDDGGRRVRLQANADGTAQVLWFEAGAQVGADLGPCATMQVEQTGLTVNDVKGVRGDAALTCTSGSPTVVGTIDFDRCATPLF